MPGTGMLQDPMVTNLAMSYGRDFVGKGQEEIKKNLDKYVSIGQLKVGLFHPLDPQHVGYLDPDPPKYWNPRILIQGSKY